MTREKDDLERAFDEAYRDLASEPLHPRDSSPPHRILADMLKILDQRIGRMEKLQVESFRLSERLLSIVERTETAKGV